MSEITLSADSYYDDIKRKLKCFSEDVEWDIAKKFRENHHYVNVVDTHGIHKYYDFCQRNFGDNWIWSYADYFFLNKEDMQMFVFNFYDDVVRVNER